MKNKKQIPMFHAGFNFTVSDKNNVTEYTVRRVLRVEDYPSGEFIRFQYEMEHVITFRNGSKLDPFRFVKSERGVLELMEPAERQWYSPDTEL